MYEWGSISHEIFLLLACISAFDDAYHVQSLSTVTYSVSPIKTHLRLEVPRRFVNYINSSEHATLCIHSYPSNRELSTSSTTFKPKHIPDSTIIVWSPEFPQNTLA